MLVLIIEDDMDIAETIGDYLALENMDCDFAYDGEAGLQASLKTQYDVILLDLTLPKLDGLEVCEKLREMNVTAPILMTTARDALADKVLGLDAGADDYLIKPFEFEELAARIRAAVRRARGLSSELTIGDLGIKFREKQAERSRRKLKLSPILWKILEHLARNSPNIVSKDELTRAVWGDDVPDSDSLRVHLFKLRRQVQRPSEPPLLHTIAGVGYVLSEKTD